jgi:MFS family permease
MSRGSTEVGDPPKATPQEATEPSPRVSPGPSPSTRRASLWHNRDFVQFWSGETLSLYGTQITILALPLTAVLVFHAGARELGLLRFLELLPYPAFSLLFGVWVDRSRRRPLMLGANLARMILLALVPILAAAGQLNLVSLMVITFAVGGASVLFDVSWMSYIPTLIQDRRHLVEANTKLGISASSADVAGPGLAGVIVGILTAPVALALDSFSYLVSLVSLLLIRVPEPHPPAPAERRRVGKELVEGLRWVFGHPYLRPVAFVGFFCNFFLMFVSSMFLYAVRDRALSPSTLGLILSMGAAGGLLGSLIAGPTVRRGRLGRIYRLSMAAVFLGPALIPAAGGSKAVVEGMFIASFFVSYSGLSVANVVIVSLRQAVTPPSLMGRMSAGMRMMLFGGGALGSLTGGVLGGAIGLRGALAVAAVGSAAMVVPTALSPVARLAALPVPVDAELMLQTPTETLLKG